jgi:TatD DNase family protein
VTGLPEYDVVDTHAHLVDERLASDLDLVLSRAWSAGVRQILAIGTTASDSEECVRLAAQSQFVHAAVGIQPNHVAEADAHDFEVIERLAVAPRVAAIGETGLDRYWDRTPFDQQVQTFERHLDLARRHGLPVVIHCREAERDVCDVLRSCGPPIRGVLHSFTGSLDDAQAFLELGLFLSFAGMITYANKSLDSLREVARRIPTDRMLVETDSPYLTPVPFRGKRNEPAHVIHTLARVAELRGMKIHELADVTTRNARELFRLPRQELTGS